MIENGAKDKDFHGIDLSAINTKDLLAFRMDWIIAEYAEVKKEIHRRSREQFLCVSGSSLAMAAAFGLVAKHPNSLAPLLLVIPWVLSIFSVYWSDHAYSINKAGKYMKHNLHAQVNAIKVNGLPEIGWSVSRHTRRRHKVTIHTILPLLFFTLPSVVSLILFALIRWTTQKELSKQALFELPEPIAIIFIVLGGLMISASFLMWRRWFVISKEE